MSSRLHSIATRRRLWLAVPLALCAAACTAPVGPSTSTSAATSVSATTAAAGNGDDLLIVDCLMPAHVRKLGAFATGVSPRRPEKVTARECSEAGGEYALASRDGAAALRLWLPFAQGGDAQAQTQVGELYERGIGSIADPAAAAGWYRRSADQGDLRAMVNLASLLERGIGVNRDPQHAAQLFRRASGLDPAPTPISIHVIDPVVVLPAPFPGQTPANVALTRAVDGRTLTGRVISDAVKRAVTVNGETVPVDALGVFHVSPDLSRGPVELNIVASDTSGRRAAVTLTASARDAAARAGGADAASTLGGGSAYALIIANQNYRHWDLLDTPQKDGRDLKAVLEKRFGFRTSLLVDATRRDIFEALNRMRTRLEPNDSLLVFYAGHGEVDPVTRRGYWIPVDGDRRMRSNWISVLDVTDQLSAVSARQVLVVADSCYSGTMARSALASATNEIDAASRSNALLALAHLRTRVAMTSGGDEPVADGGAGRNSLFARSLIDVLSAVDEPTEAQRIFGDMSARFTLRAQALRLRQRPDYAPIRFAGHEAGDFVFMPRSSNVRSR